MRIMNMQSIAFLAVLACSCGGGGTSPKPARASERVIISSITETPKGVACRVDDQGREHVHFPYWKKVSVYLEEKTTHLDLRLMARKLESLEERGFERTVVRFFLPSSPTNYFQWANAIVDSHLKVVIQGFTIDGYREIASRLTVPHRARLHGRWEWGGLPAVYSLFSRDGIYWSLVTLQDDGEVKSFERRVEDETGTKYHSFESPEEYMQIRPDGSLIDSIGNIYPPYVMPTSETE